MAELDRASLSPEAGACKDRVSFADFIEQNSDVKEAYLFAKEAHEGQVRISGDPYITHPRNVARRLHDLGIRDKEMIKAALLHDVPEDTIITLEQIEEKFGGEVALLVDGVTEFKSDKQIPKETKDRETLRKSFKYTKIDPRVAIIKAAADRPENMETLWVMEKDRQVKKALETYAYTKLLESLGVWTVMEQLEDEALKYSSPEEFEIMSQILDSDFRLDPRFVGFWKSTLEKTLQDNNFDFEIVARKSNRSKLKHKMELSDVKDINDLMSLRIIVKNKVATGTKTEIDNAFRDHCYRILGVIRQQFGHMEDQKRFDDFFSFPQPNGYSAIQLTMNTPHGCFEIVITSEEKEEFNNWGVVSLMRKGIKDLASYSRILVFTESDEVKFFPDGATGVDFAYSISELMGAQASGILINGREYPITEVLPNGAQLKVLLGKNRVAPEIDYRGMCLPGTQKIIDRQIVSKERGEFIEKGRAIIEKVIADRGLIDLKDLLEMNEHVEKLVNFLYLTGCKRSLGNLYYKAGKGRIPEEYIKRMLDATKITRQELKLNSLLIQGEDVKGVLEYMGAKIKEFGGNVGPLNSKPEKHNSYRDFSSRLIIENLKQKDLKKLQKALLKNPAIKKVEIV